MNSDPLGKRALYGPPISTPTEPSAQDKSDNSRGKYTLFSETKAPVATPTPEANAKVGELITLECSSCRKVTKVDFIDFALMQLTLRFWHPGKGFTRLMRCPACRKQTWISASLTRKSH